jgi:hypothetical protein
MNGRAYNRMIDPLLGLLGPANRPVKLELAGPRKPGPRVYPAVPAALPAKPALGKVPKGVAGLKPVAEAYRRIFGEPLPAKALQKHLLQLWALRRHFAAILNQYRPGAVLLVCYYAPLNLAVTAACRRLGIPVADIQHGQQGLYHAMYNHWTAVPEGGYDLVPDYFWVWGRPTRDILLRDLPEAAAAPRPLVGGNQWVGMWREQRGLRFSAPLSAFLDELRQAPKTVIVCLQGIADPIPEFLVAAMRARPAWNWLIRLHPHQRGRKDQFAAYLTAQGVTRFEIEKATYAPLYGLLGACDHMVTPFSSTVWEAAAFGCPATLIHEQARDVHGPWIDRGVFALALGTEDLLTALDNRGPETLDALEEPYIESEAALARRAFGTLLPGHEPDPCAEG